MKLRFSPGFSLVEVMIALGILSIVTAGMISLIKNTYGSQRILNARFDRMDIDSSLRSILGSADTCYCNFKGMEFAGDPTELKKPKPVSEIKLYNAECTSSSDLIQSGKTLPGSLAGMNVEDISLINAFEISPTRYAFDLQVQMKAAEVPDMKPVLIRNLMMNTKDIGSGKLAITSCSSSGPAPELVPNTCYEVTCTSLFAATKTLKGKTSASGDTLTSFAPSGRGLWVIKVAGGEIAEALNCHSDQAADDGSAGSYQLNNQGLCTAHAADGRKCPVYGNCTYKKGAANPFAKCSYDECDK